MPALSSLPDASIYANAQAPQAMSLQNLVDLGRSSTALQREKALLQPSIAKGVAESETAVTGAESAKAKLQKDYFGIAADEANALVNDPRLAKVNPADHKTVWREETHGGPRGRGGFWDRRHRQGQAGDHVSR